MRSATPTGTGPEVGGVAPESVETPASVGEVREVLARASAEGLGVVPVGLGSALGPEAPEGPFLVLSTAALAGIEDYEPADLTLTAGAGTPLRALGDALAPHRQWLPFDPPGVTRRSLGGLVATGARGPLAAAYGAPRDHVLGVTLVTGDGRVLRLGGRVMKNVAGFDLLKLVVGSRGTLGVITSATVRVFPTPQVDRALILRDASLPELARVARSVATAPVAPASAVVARPLPGGGGAGLIVRLHGSGATADAEQAVLERHAGVTFEVLEGGPALELFATVGDPGRGGGVAVRATALPADLGALLEALDREMSRAGLLADAMAGRAWAAVEGEPPVAARLTMLRSELEGLGGSFALVAGSSALAAEVGTGASAPGTPELASQIKRRFDPGGVLSPGRFVA